MEVRYFLSFTNTKKHSGSEHQLQDAHWIHGTLKCTSPSDVFTLLKASDFVSHDLMLGLYKWNQMDMHGGSQNGGTPSHQWFQYQNELILDALGVPRFFGILHVSMHKQLLCGQLVEFTIAESCWDSDVEICPNDFPWYQFWLSNQLWHVQPNSLQCMFSGIIYDEWNLQPLKHIETMSLALQKRDASSRWGVTPLTTATALASDKKHSPWSCDGGTRCMSQVNFESLYEMIIWLPSASDKPLVFLSTCFKRRTGNIAVYFMIPTFGPCVFQYLLTCSNVVAVLVVVYSWIWVRCAATALAMIYLTTVPGKKEQEAIRNAISTFFEDKASWEPNDLQANLSQPREISALLFVLHDFHVVVCKI